MIRIIAILIGSWMLYFGHVNAELLSKESLLYNNYQDIPSISGNQLGSINLIGLLSLIQNIFLTIVLPIVAIGSFLWIAYQLLTAEGDESKMKQAWRSIVYTACALITIALSYGLIELLSRIDL